MPTYKRARTSKRYSAYGKAKGRGAYKYRSKRTYKRPSNRRTGGFVGQEVKFLDLARAADIAAPTVSTAAGTLGQIGNAAADPTTVVGTGAANCLNCPKIGNSISDRDGRQIWMRSIEVSGTVYCRNYHLRSATAVIPTYVIVALVLDTQCNAATNDMSQVFVTPGATISSANQWNLLTSTANPMINLQYKTRYRVLKLKKILLPPDLELPVVNDTPTGYMGMGSRQFTLSHRFKGKGLVTNYVGSTSNGSVTDIADNALHVMCYSAWDGTAVAGGSAIIAQLVYNSRLRFTG